MATYSSNTTIKIFSAIDASSFATSANQYAICTVIIPAAGGSITITSGIAQTHTIPASATSTMINGIYLGPGHTISVSTGRVTGVVFQNTP